MCYFHLVGACIGRIIVAVRRPRRAGQPGNRSRTCNQQSEAACDDLGVICDDIEDELRQVLDELERPGATDAGGARYGRAQHTPLALRVHVGLWHYVQNVVLEALTSEADDVFGVVELHFRSRESLRNERYDSEAGRQAVREDIPRFMSLDRTQGGYFVERIVRTPRDAAAGPPA